MALARDDIRSSQGGATRRRHARLWAAVTAIEVVAASVAVALDLLIPTFILLALAGVSLVVRREGPSSLGFHRVGRGGRLALQMLVFAAIWSVVQLSVVIPLAHHLSGTQQDFSSFEGLQGDVAMLVGLLVLSWTLAALGEETAYRGYLQTRMKQMFGGGRTALVLAVLVSSLLFGVAHTEQGIVGVIATGLDAIAFSVVRYRHKTLWASVLAHGFNNTIGFVAFFLFGPIHGFW